ncbi:hypothetical protein XY58_11910 [Stenotrophomonas maltophilia]|nr:hypothetical protein L681_04500 [Stenotrophomonas maltophilia MF89]KKF87900.1 hypothetical protein XY58_11910 [Stenotrophomonas maltophilia]
MSLGAIAQRPHLRLQGHAVQRFRLKRQQQSETVLELVKRAQERLMDLISTALHCGRVGDAPVGGSRVAWPHGTRFTRGTIAHRYDEIHLRCFRTCECIPRLARQPGNVEANLREHLQGHRMNYALGMTARTVSADTFAP